MARCLAVLAVLTTFATPLREAHAAACGDLPDLLILLDRSASMSLDNKWNDAKSAISNLLTAYGGTIRFGLQFFPSNGPCKANVIEVGCGANTQAAIMNALNTTTPSGNATPLALALAVADVYLKGIDPGKTKYVLVITDGNETCTTANPVTYCQNLANDGFKTYVVGFGNGVNVTVLNAMATAGGTALPGTTKYYSASNYAQLDAALKSIAGTVTCCGNGVLDPGETCDTAIPSGAGKCPTSCNDSNACTVDTMTGAECNTACSHTPITAPVNGDGCCPPGATSITDSDCVAVCGNGLLELGETCDTAIGSGPGKCPTLAACDDLNVCTTDALTGSACTAKCTNTPKQPSLAAKDSCCPPGATSLTDLDCPVVCGNGVKEAGETCDTGIASGAGKCPALADCNDGSACTADTLTGSACTLACQHSPVAASLAAKDGCCPTGATSLTDLDCVVVCGNGVVESGESCDTAIASGTGKCPTLATCNDGDVCTADAVAGGSCTASCTHTLLAPNLAVADGCCPPGASLTNDLDCLPDCGNGVLDAGESCDPKILSGAGRCPVVADCNDGNSCTTDAISGSACTAKCTNPPIAASLVAKDGCCPAGATAQTDLDCGAICGNGVTEAGEACDTAISSGTGKCPALADCNDANPCTADTLGGSGCTTACAHAPVAPSLASKDGCCPLGATSLSDVDCSAGCGNGVLEPGEVCDPKIASGTGACPTLASCDDGDPCTTDLLAGGPCTLVCVHGSTAADPTKVDGCCPKGASPVTDKDCQAVCGNGLLEPGETCDTAIASGLGSCATAEACEDSDDCTVDALVGSGCAAHCANTPVPPSGATKDGCCAKGQSSKTDADCPPPCDADKTTGCVDLCEGVSCPAGQFCKQGECVPFPDGGIVVSFDAGLTPPRTDGWIANNPDGCNCRLAASASEPPLGALLLLGLFCLLVLRRR